MTVEHSTAASRAQSRRGWPIRTYRLGEEPSHDLTASTTPVERLEMMWPLALEAWSLTGRPLPDYVRGEEPLFFFRRRA